MRNAPDGEPRAQLEQYPRPGMHSHNRMRQPRAQGPRRWGLRVLRFLLLAAGLTGLGYYGWNLAGQSAYQAYANWAFEQELAGRPGGVRDWIMQTTPLGSWTGYQIPKLPERKTAASAAGAASGGGVPTPAYGAILGRLDVPRLGLQAMVRQGADAATLRNAVGHVPSTQLAGAAGNFVIAAHRDTLFRKLRGIRIGDRVQFQSTGGDFTYQVTATKIVRPNDLSVLKPQGERRLLTMITCYPFTYVGSAPERFIVSADLMPSDAPERASTGGAPEHASTDDSRGTPHRPDRKWRRESKQRRSERASARRSLWRHWDPLPWSGG